ncbi:MAG: hypothetical protein ABIA77_07155, partial [Candidatus Omnitrophota bacterium]
YWDGNTTTQITDNTTMDYDPSLYNGTITCESYPADWSCANISYWDGNTTTQIIDNATYNESVSLHNGDIAWMSDITGDYDIYYARLASAWIDDALTSLSLGYSLEEIGLMADLYDTQGSGLEIDTLSWSYLSGNLPGDIDGLVYEIGDSWEYDGNYYIKLGSGLEGAPLGGGVPELPAGAMPLFGVFFSVVFVRRKTRRS